LSRASSHQCRRSAAVLLLLAWAFWLHRWVPALLVVTFAVWATLHHRLEAGLGDPLRRRWRRVWPPGPLVLIALLLGSTLAFGLHDAPAKVKILPVGLDVLGLSVILFGPWWTLLVLPQWLGGAGPWLSHRWIRGSPRPVRNT
jgi:energy-coupling factor transporter transmembrane protein EcfT